MQINFAQMCFLVALGVPFGWVMCWGWLRIMREQLNANEKEAAIQWEAAKAIHKAKRKAATGSAA